MYRRIVAASAPPPAASEMRNPSRAERFITLEDRARRNHHRGGVLWFTGLPGSGKSTLAFALERALFEKGYSVYVLDGDNMRQGLNGDLGFSPEDRAENIRRAGEVAALFCQAGMLSIAAFISPYGSDRERARKAAGDGFHEIYVKADLETCMRRDPKGLYSQARRGEIHQFTGVSAPYEVPEHPDLVVDTSQASVDASLATLTDFVAHRFEFM